MARPITQTHSDLNAASATFYAVGGSLRNDAPSYVERQADHELFDALNRHEFCYILTSRQMGKSSLMVRTVHRLRQEGTRALVLDLTAIGSNLTAEQWYLGLLDRLAEQLGQEEECEDYWQAHLDRGPLQRWMGALREVVLTRLSAPVVLFLDEIDAVRSLPFSTDEFFAAIRECYNRRADEEIYRHLTFCLLGVAAPSDLIRDTRLTPFNIGTRIELTDFTLQEAGQLAEGLGPNPPTPFPDAFAALTGKGESSNAPPSLVGKGVGGLGLLARILYWTDGHPYLTQRLCQAVAERLAANNQPSAALVDAVCSDLFLASPARERDDNLLFVRERLLRSEVDLVTLLDTYGRVVAGKRVADEASNGVVTALRLSGAVKGERGWLRVRNRIYGRVFDGAWVRENLPYAELWRQQRAYRRGLVRALTGSGVVLAVMAALAWGAFSNARRADANAAAARKNAANLKLALQDAQNARLASDRNARLATQQAEQARKAKQLADQRRLQIADAFGKEREAKQEATQQKAKAIRQRDYANRMLYIANINLIPAAWENNDIHRVLALLRETQSYPERGFEWYYWQRMCHLELFTLKGHAKGVSSVAFSPDGKRIVTGSYDRTAKVWDAVSSRHLLTIKEPDNKEPEDFIASVLFSPDGKSVLTGSHDGTVRVWDAVNGRERLTLPGSDGPVNPGSLSPDGKRIVTTGNDGTGKVWDAVTGRQLLTLKGHDRPVSAAAYSADGMRIVAGCADNTATVWDAVTGQDLFSLKGNTDRVFAVAFSLDGKRIVTGSIDGVVKVWDAVSGGELLSIKGKDGLVNSVSFSPDGKRILTTSQDNTAKIWSAQDGRLLLTLKGHIDEISSAAFSPDGKRIVTGSQDGTAKVWDTLSGREWFALKGHTDWILATTISLDSKRIVTGSQDGTAKVWDAFSGRELLTLNGHALKVMSVAISPDGRRIVTGYLHRPAQVWDAVTGRELYALTGHVQVYEEVAFSPNGRRIITSGDSVKVWDAVSGRALCTFRGLSGVYSISYAPDGNRIVTGNWDNTAKVWDAASGRLLLTLKGHTGTVYSASFSPDGKRIVTGSFDHTARVWDAADGRQLHTLEGHSNAVHSVSFSADGKRIVTGSYDNTVKVWDAVGGLELLTLKHPDSITSVSFSPDGTRIVAGSQDGSAIVWQAENPEQVATQSHQNMNAALLQTVTETDNVARIKFLVEHGARVNARDQALNTPLILAAEQGHLRTMRFLVLHGAQIDARNHDGNTALLQATDEGQLQAVLFLLERGANVHAKNRFGADALWLTGRTDQPGAENAPAIRKLLLEHIRQEKRRHNVRMQF